MSENYSKKTEDDEEEEEEDEDEEDEEKQELEVVETFRQLKNIYSLIPIFTQAKGFLRRFFLCKCRSILKN